MMYVQAFGAIGLIVTMPFYGAEFAWRDVLIGASGGWIGVMGLALLYRGLARGPMAVVAPLTALTAAVVPVAWDVAKGNRPSAVTWIGIVVGLVAIVVISSERDHSTTPVSVRVVAEALAAGACFGLYFSIISEAAEDSAPWPIVGSRVVTVVGLVTLVLVRRIPVQQVERRWIMFFGGLCDTGANVTFLFALEHGSLAAVAVMSSLYPAATVLCARVVLHEKLDRIKIAGLVIALVAVGLIAGG